jgi:2,3-bisphosphoglycerate-dependent phosphoglycerate mutase
MLQLLYLIRHAQPKLGTGIAYDRAPGPPLSDVGRDEARAAGLYLSQCRLEALYVSPLDRTQETARVIAEQVALTPRTEEALAEHRSDETFDQVKARMRDFLAGLEGEQVRIAGFVTHGSPIKAALQLLSNETLNLTSYAFDNGNHAPTAGIWRAQRADGSWRIDLAFMPSMVRTY